MIDHSHERLDSRLAHLEKRTKEQVFHLNQTMKESFAQERGECLDRMDRRALRERIAIERQQLVSEIAFITRLGNRSDRVSHGTLSQLPVDQISRNFVYF